MVNLNSTDPHALLLSRSFSRRDFMAASGSLGALALLGGCASPLPLVAAPAASDADAERRLRQSAEAHGWAAYKRLHDINVRYEGEWRPLVDSVQPAVVDKTYRGGSEERILPAQGVVAQAYRGTAGTKQVTWRREEGTPAHPGAIAVWRNGMQTADADTLSAAALVAEGYGMFLLGPLWVLDRAERSGQPLVCEKGGSERVDGHPCEIVRVWLRPGLGRVSLDRAALSIDIESGLMRRVRFTLEGFRTTQGAVAMVDTFDHRRLFGVTWPMRSYEEVIAPIRLPAHDWRITGLDVDRGWDVGSVSGSAFSGLAAAPAQALP